MRVSIVLGLMTFAASSLAAQHQEHQAEGQAKGQMQMQGQMQMAGQEHLPGPLRAYAPFAPEKVLAASETLGLSAEQTAKLKAIAEWARKANEQAHAPAHAAMMSARDELAKASPDTAVVRLQIAAHATAEGNMQWLQLSAALQVQAVLTAEQRAKVTAQ